MGCRCSERRESIRRIGRAITSRGAGAKQTVVEEVRFMGRTALQDLTGAIRRVERARAPVEARPRPKLRKPETDRPARPKPLSLKANDRTWSVPMGAWSGEACFIVGGGPSLNGFDFDALLGNGRIIAVNAAYRVLPFADILFFSDKRFHEWNCESSEFIDFQGEVVSTHCGVLRGRPDIRQIRNVAGPVSNAPDGLAGRSSGSRALNLAYLLGASPIYLLGFDMRPNGNWHDFHELKNLQFCYESKFVPDLEAMGAAILARGVAVVNGCLDSAVDVFPKVAPGAVLPCG